MYEDIKLGIAIPHNKSTPMSLDFFITFTVMNKPSEYTLIIPKVEFDGGYESIAHVRNDMVKEAIEQNCTHILFMDSDQSYPAHTIDKLLSWNLPVVGAAVFRRYPPFDPILLRNAPDTDDWQKMIYVPEEEWKKEELIKVDATGSGCMLIETSVFFDLKYPWYRTIKENPKFNRRRMGEDIFFCLKRLKQAGYEVWVDTKIGIGHEARINVNESFYDLTRGMKFK